MKYILVILVSCMCSIIISVITNRIIAFHYIKVIDGYVKDIMEMIKDLIRTTYFKE